MYVSTQTMEEAPANPLHQPFFNSWLGYVDRTLQHLDGGWTSGRSVLDLPVDGGKFGRVVWMK